MKLDRKVFADLKLIIFDVDGILTDGRIYHDDSGREMKAFNSKDGLGIRMLQKAGFEVAFLTGRSSHLVDRRAAELGVGTVIQGAADKLAVFEKLLAAKSLRPFEAAYAGDDLPDLPVLRRVGLALAPADAVQEVKAEADYVCRNKGGRGAAREMADLILRGSDRWAMVAAEYY
ncbi:MAG: HAD hydrolase family protein [Pseudomonadota bacterium]